MYIHTVPMHTVLPSAQIESIKRAGEQSQLRRLQQTHHRLQRQNHHSRGPMNNAKQRLIHVDQSILNVSPTSDKKNNNNKLNGSVTSACGNNFVFLTESLEIYMCSNQSLIKYSLLFIYLVCLSTMEQSG